MQMLAVVIRGNEGTRLNRRIQPDPSRSFPNKRSGRRSKMLTFVTALKYQKDNRRISLQGPHFTSPPIPGYCFSVWLPHCRAFRTIPQTLPLCLWPWKPEEGSHPGSSVMKSPIGHHVLCGNQALYSCGLQGYPLIAAALHFLATCVHARRPPTSW